jgi:predicted Zn-dependent protease
MNVTAVSTPSWPRFNRRDFLRLSTLAAAGWLSGCAANPVTGKSQLMLVSEQEEIQLDRQYSPRQFSSDYGVTQDQALNAYISQTGVRLASLSHRPQMPYRFQVVNATYVNAYAFPGGSIAATRGILLKLQDEGELASLLGHELGHVNARHTAQQMSKGMLTQALVGGVSALAGSQGNLLGDMTAQLGALGAGIFLASYSRDNEREADALGLRYMASAGYSPDGFTGLMKILLDLNHHQSNAVELLFATHPMSDERYQTAQTSVQKLYPNRTGLPLYRERYMDQTASLRKLAGAIEAMQKGESELARKNYTEAENHLQTALKIAPEDYAANLIMAQCQYFQKRFDLAERYAQDAHAIYPAEAQASLIMGFAGLQTKHYEAALAAFAQYDQQLPGDPELLFWQGYCQENRGKREEAAKLYRNFLSKVQQGKMAQHAYQRLVEWGYVRP